MGYLRDSEGIRGKDIQLVAVQIQRFLKYGFALAHKSNKERQGFTTSAPLRVRISIKADHVIGADDCLPTA